VIWCDLIPADGERRRLHPHPQAAGRVRLHRRRRRPRATTRSSSGGGGCADTDESRRAGRRREARPAGEGGVLGGTGRGRARAQWLRRGGGNTRVKPGPSTMKRSSLPPVPHAPRGMPYIWSFVGGAHRLSWRQDCP
jgi:hypothetical protein